MTNEEKARAIIGEDCKKENCLQCGGRYSAEKGGCAEYQKIMQMADWKDNQLKQLLSEHMEHATGQRLEAFMDLYRELFEQNAPENLQATRLSTTETDITKLLSTPRELCMDCYNWCAQEDVGQYDIPQCSEGCYPETHNYLIGLSNTCPKHLVQ